MDDVNIQIATLNTVVDVTDDVLADLGLSNLTEGRRVYQANGQIIIGTDVPVEGLTPPPIEPEEAIIVTDEEEAASIEEAVAQSTALEVTELVNEVLEQHTEAELTTEEIIKILPENPKMYEIDDAVSRFSGAAWFKAIQESTVILAGLGGIGSYVLFLLSRMRPKQMFIYDDDVVERANMSGQLYNKNMIGRQKVNAMNDLAIDFSDYYGINAIPNKWTNETEPGDIMICGFDNMKARRTFFNSWIKHLRNHPCPEKCLFIDGRLNAEEFQVFCMRGDDKYNINKYYNEYLFNDSESESVACSYKQTTFCANMIGSVIVNLYTNFIANTLHPTIERDLPFKTYYAAGMMFFKTEL